MDSMEIQQDDALLDLYKLSYIYLQATQPKIFLYDTVLVTTIYDTDLFAVAYQQISIRSVTTHLYHFRTNSKAMRMYNLYQNCKTDMFRLCTISGQSNELYMLTVCSISMAAPINL